MKYYIITGERSGDLHASNLIKAIKREDSQAVFRGVGGEYSQSAGVDLFFHYKEISFMGIMDVVANLSKIRKALTKTQKDILEFQPDVIIPVDFGGFNMRISRFAHQHKLKVFYYISPKIWAWNQKRAYKIKALVDRMFVILPFEKEFYKKFDYEVDYVGNPVYDAVASHSVDPDFKIKNDLNKKSIIAILPGSRKQEVLRMLEYMVSIRDLFPEYEFVIAGVSNLPKTFYEPFEKQSIKVIVDDTYNLLVNSEAAVVASGTATLETGLFEIPQVVCYKTGVVTYAIGSRLVKVDFISLVNLIAGKEVVKELLQKDFTPENIAMELKKILKGSAFRSKQLEGYKELKKILGTPGASEKAAKLMVKYLKQY